MYSPRERTKAALPSLDETHDLLCFLLRRAGRSEVTAVFGMGGSKPRPAKGKTAATPPAKADSDAQLAAECDELLSSYLKGGQDCRQSLLVLTQVHPASSLPRRALLLARTVEMGSAREAADGSLPSPRLYAFVKESSEAVAAFPNCVLTRSADLLLRQRALQQEVLELQQIQADKEKHSLLKRVFRRRLEVATQAAESLVNSLTCEPVTAVSLPVLRLESDHWFGAASPTQWETVLALRGRHCAAVFSYWDAVTGEETTHAADEAAKVCPRRK